MTRARDALSIVLVVGLYACALVLAGWLAS
jgi:hypothetical protein